ncbi:hypothetical protein GCM10007421_19520 [Halopseudomonas oceani]|uniref:Glycosyl transferase family 1 domain-containing protein n=1 Tax=Halopseudomonas oceani TaxID=1708783 RepID=A0A2P4EVH0_9GAMM|nr:glycosyltransferase [Halopseudomonas oceani]POB03583.1 hypothetical protein C1949_09425 [Halopseudomonas oceani]GGE45448.1 hypothetical protein GCM10007421_19520 [Halopseudomonas oceani]
MKKKICFMITDAVSFNVLCRGQLEYIKRELDADVTLICGGDNDEIHKLKGRGVGKVCIFPFERKPSLLKDFYCLFALFLFFCWNRFDLVVYSTPKAMLLGSLSSAFSFQKKRVALVRGRVYENFSGIKRYVFLFFDRIAFRFSHEVVFISSSLMASYIDEGVADSRCARVLAKGSSNGVDIDRFVPARENCGPFRVVTVGRLCVDKGVVQLDKIVRGVKAKNPAIEFEFVGKIEDARSSEIVERLLEIDGVTHFENDPCVEQVFQRADLHLFLSNREGFGNVALEAAACGVPTLGLDVVGVRDSISQGVSGMRFDVDDVSGIINEIIRASGDREAYRQQYSGARCWAMENFSQIVVWSAYVDFYADLLGYK